MSGKRIAFLSVAGLAACLAWYMLGRSQTLSRHADAALREAETSAVAAVAMIPEGEVNLPAAQEINGPAALQQEELHMKLVDAESATEMVASYRKTATQARWMGIGCLFVAATGLGLGLRRSKKEAAPAA